MALVALLGGGGAAGSAGGRRRSPSTQEGCHARHVRLARVLARLWIRTGDDAARDAVIGAEFEHGDNGEPLHLSGMIIRYSTPIPPHVDLGEIDIPSDENDQDKGLAELTARGHAMGGDQVIGVTFEHGDNGEKGHLKGHVVRYTR